jgi:hypothetical protein
MLTTSNERSIRPAALSTNTDHCEAHLQAILYVMWHVPVCFWTPIHLNMYPLHQVRGRFDLAANAQECPAGNHIICFNGIDQLIVAGLMFCLVQ